MSARVRSILVWAALVAVMVGALPAVLVGYSVVHQSSHRVTATTSFVKAPCDQGVDAISVWRDDPTPCDVQAPQRLDVYGLTLAECDDQGGELVLVNPEALGTGNDGDPEGVTAYYVCEGVDY